MKLIRRLLPSPPMTVAIIALLLALTGTSYAAFGLGILNKGAKDKTVGVGPLTYVTTNVSVPPTGNFGFDITGTCPGATFPVTSVEVV